MENLQLKKIRIFYCFIFLSFAVVSAESGAAILIETNSLEKINQDDKSEQRGFPSDSKLKPQSHFTINPGSAVEFGQRSKKMALAQEMLGLAGVVGLRIEPRFGPNDSPVLGVGMGQNHRVLSGSWKHQLAQPFEAFYSVLGLNYHELTSSDASLKNELNLHAGLGFQSSIGRVDGIFSSEIFLFFEGLVFNPWLDWNPEAQVGFGLGILF